MKIVICSKGRYQGEIKTINALQGIFKKEDIILLVEPNEVALYHGTYGGQATIKALPQNGQGLRYSRNFAYQLFDEPIAMCDDDITGFYIRITQKKMRKLFPKELKRMFEKLEDSSEEYPEVTVSYRPSNYLFEGTKKENTRAWCFKVWNLRKLKELGVRINTENNLYEDYDFTLTVLSKGGKNLSYFNYAFDCIAMGKNKGGVSTYRRELNEKSVAYMKEKWGNILRVFYSENHKQNEISVYWKKAVKSFSVL